MRFLSIFKYNLLSYMQQIWFFSGIISIYNPTSAMCNFWLLLAKGRRVKGDWALASVTTQFKIFFILSCSLRPQVWCRWDRSFDKCFYRIVESCCRVLKICYKFVWDLARWFGDVMAFASHLPKWGKKILVKNLSWQVQNFWFQRREGG